MKTPSIQMPRLFNLFDHPEIKSVRATTSIRTDLDLEDVLEHVPRAEKTKTASYIVAKFELKRGEYLLYFPNGYIQVYAPNEEGVREVLRVFRDELFKNGLL